MNATYLSALRVLVGEEEHRLVLLVDHPTNVKSNYKTELKQNNSKILVLAIQFALLDPYANEALLSSQRQYAITQQLQVEYLHVCRWSDTEARRGRASDDGARPRRAARTDARRTEAAPRRPQARTS